jgi:glycosyltransferase involved in cell wall biosynthesis
MSSVSFEKREVSSDTPEGVDSKPAKCWVARLAPEDVAAFEHIARLLGESALRQLSIYQLPADFKLSIAMPVYNEKQTIHEILRRVQAVPIRKEIIVVDDCSTDGTREVLQRMEGEPDLRVFYHEYNQGKGAALRTAFKYVSGDAVIIQDADLEYDPAEYPRLLQPIVDGRADVVFGSRFIGDVVRIHLFWHRVANGILTLLSNLFTNLNLTDMETCYKVFKREVLDSITIKQNRFGVEPELTAKVARRKFRIYEVPISYSGRGYAEGKKIGLKDAFKALYCIIRYGLAD